MLKENVQLGKKLVYLYKTYENMHNCLKTEKKKQETNTAAFINYGHFSNNCM